MAASLQLVEACQHFYYNQELGLSSLGVLNASWVRKGKKTNPNPQMKISATPIICTLTHMVLLSFPPWKLLNRSQSLCIFWVFSHFWIKLNYFKQYFCNLLVAVLNIQLFTLILSVYSFSYDVFLYLVALRTAIQNTEKKMWNVWSLPILNNQVLQSWITLVFKKVDD